MSEEKRDPSNPHPGIEVTEINGDKVHMIDGLVNLAPALRAQIAMGTTKTEAQLIELASKHAGITEIKDKAGREQAHSAAMELMRARTTVSDVAKKARDDATKFSKAVIAEEQRLVAIVEPEEKRLKGLRDAWDEEQERLKREKAEAERLRILAITGKINDIKAYVQLAAQCRSSTRIQELIDRLTAMEISPDFYAEFTDDAAAIKSTTLNQMAVVLKTKQDQEAEAKRLADERAEQERVRQELEERERQLNAQAAELARKQREIEDAQAAAQKPAEPIESTLVLGTDTVVIPIMGSAEIPAAMDAAHAPAATEQMPQPAAAVQHATAQAPAVKKPTRPTDDEIIDALALHFRVHESKVIEWLQDMDLQAAADRMVAAEFN